MSDLTTRHRLLSKVALQILDPQNSYLELNQYYQNFGKNQNRIIIPNNKQENEPQPKQQSTKIEDARKTIATTQDFDEYLTAFKIANTEANTYQEVKYLKDNITPSARNFGTLKIFILDGNNTPLLLYLCLKEGVRKSYHSH